MRAATSTRDRILDAAAAIIHERGIAKATTREIARGAGLSEAALYKYFSDKQEIFLGVLSERVPGIADPTAYVGTATVRENLVTITAQFFAFYARTFPMAASIFSERELLDNWRAGMAARGAGPSRPPELIAAYLDAEIGAGRIPVGVDSWSIATLISGAALQQAFLASFAGDAEVSDPRDKAERLVAALALD